MPQAAVNGVRLHYESTGKGFPLVMLHGFMGSTASWQDHIPAFEASHRVITLDLLGHGQSDSPNDAERYRMGRCCEDLAVLFHKLRLTRFCLLGYSMGGRVALQFAMTRPELLAGLVLESASPGLADPVERATRLLSDEMRAEQIEQQGLDAFVSDWETEPLFNSQSQLSAATRSRVRQERLSNNPVGLANALRGMGTGVQSSLWDRLPDLSMPTLLIAGEMDEKYRRIGQEMAAQLPQARLSVVSGAGHTVHLEQPALFDTLVTSFLAELN